MHILLYLLPTDLLGTCKKQIKPQAQGHAGKQRFFTNKKTFLFVKNQRNVAEIHHMTQFF